MKREAMGMSRRSFLKGASVLAGAGVAGMGIVACSPSGEAAEEAAADEATEAASTAEEFSLQTADETVEADVVVVGAGMGGLCAALEASDQGANVVLIEANDMLGGATNYAEGMFGAGTKMQEELGITDLNPAEVLAIEYDFQNYNVDTKMWEIVARDSAEDINWLMDKGVVFDTVTGMGDTNLCWHVYEGWHGVSLVGYLTEALDKQGVQVYTSTRATELITDGDTVVGVQAQGADGIIDFKGNVVLACGGFSANDEYIEQYSNFDPAKMINYGVESAQGDGIRMVAELTGERPKNTTICIVGSGVPEFDMTSQLRIAGSMEATDIWVNALGERFVSEALTRQPSVSGNVIRCQNKKVFSIFDQKAYDRFKTEGLGTGYGMYVPPGTVCDQLDAEVEQYADNPYWWKADTIEELAEGMGVDAATLKATVDNYNKMCEDGEDTEYGKPADMLIAVDEGPFYGFEIQPIILCTMGGIRIDRECRVCNRDMEAVPGLYCASSDVSGFQGETYGITISGSCQAIACWSGRVAGKSAATGA